MQRVIWVHFTLHLFLLAGAFIQRALQVRQNKILSIELLKELTVTQVLQAYVSTNGPEKKV